MAQHEGNNSYWLITAPKTREDTFNTLNKRTSDEQNLSVNYKFLLPDLKVGTLDTLMQLSDELVKVDTFVETTTRKIATQLFDILDQMSKEAASQPGQKPQPVNYYENLVANNNNIDTYATFFRWDESKYPSQSHLKTLVDNIQITVAKLDDELKGKSSEYNTLLHTIAASERNIGGNLMVRDLSDIVKANHVVDTEYMETLFVVVARMNDKQFLESYETLAQFVLPRSAEIVIQDSEYTVYRVVIFKKFAEDFKNNARDKKFYVREFKFDPSKSGKADKKKLDTEKDKQRKALLRWCKTNFNEAFVAWIHLKAIRAFVESVLRYGLPSNFQAMLLLPNKSKVKRLRQVLNELYGHLSKKTIFADKSEEEENDSFFPYVALDVNLDFRPKNI